MYQKKYTKQLSKQLPQIEYRYLLTNHCILINPRLKKKEVAEEIFCSNLDIKYFYHDDKLLYFVGKKGTGDLKYSIDKACLVREVCAVNGKIEFEEIMKLMKVDFVRNGQYTVLPFPFKYLKEYERLLNDSMITGTCDGVSFDEEIVL